MLIKQRVKKTRSRDKQDSSTESLGPIEIMNGLYLCTTQDMLVGLTSVKKQSIFIA
jgi:hypothetical protein